jgi:hypothetical protein
LHIVNNVPPTQSGGQTIVALLLMGYSFVTQLLPALVMSLRRHNRLSSAGVAAGILIGIATVAATSLTHTTVATLFADASGGAARSEHRDRRTGAERADPDGVAAVIAPSPGRREREGVGVSPTE